MGIYVVKGGEKKKQNKTPKVLPYQLAGLSSVRMVGVLPVRKIQFLYESG